MHNALYLNVLQNRLFCIAKEPVLRCNMRLFVSQDE